MIITIINRYKSQIILLIIMLSIFAYYKIQNNNMYNYYESKIEKITKDLNYTKEMLFVKKNEVDSLSSAIDKQNTYIEQFKVENQITLDEYVKKLQEAESTRFSHIQYIGVKSNDCEILKKQIFDIRVNGF